MELCAKDGISLPAPGLSLCSGINCGVGKYTWQHVISAGGTPQASRCYCTCRVRAVHSGMRNATQGLMGAPPLAGVRKERPRVRNLEKGPISQAKRTKFIRDRSTQQMGVIQPITGTCATVLDG